MLQKWNMALKAGKPISVPFWTWKAEISFPFWNLWRSCECGRTIHSLLQLPTASASSKLPCTNELPQLAGYCINENQDLWNEVLEKTFCFFICLIDRERFTPPMSGRFRFFRHRSAFFHSQSTNSEADSFHWLYSYFSSLSVVVENGTNMSQ